MRSTRLLPMLLLAACGGDDGGNARPDAGGLADARVDAATDAAIDAATDAAIDAAIDAPIDAPPDAPVAPGTSRVWIVGDTLVANTTVAAGFLDSATAPPALPFGPSAAPPTVVPGGTAQLASGAGYSDNVFDSNGDKTAFVADLLVAGRFDLYVAAADGSAPVMLVQGTPVGTVPMLEIGSVALSPDGTKVAYTMDSAAIDNGADLHVVNTTGTPVSRRVSPDRDAAAAVPSALDVFSSYAWSADSTYLAFAGDLTENSYNQAYVVDTTAATPAAIELVARAEIGTQTLGARGVSGGILFDSAGNVYFRARLVTGGQYQLFKATPAGARSEVALPARADASVPDASAFGFSPDGTTIVFQADAPTLGAYNLFAQVLGQATVTNLTNQTASGAAMHTAPLWFSPDGSKLAVVANYPAGARREPYVVNVDGSGMRRLAAVPGNCVNCDYDELQWTVDGAFLYAKADPEVSNDTKAYRLDATMTDQTPTLAVDVPPTTGDVARVLVRGL